MEKKSGNGGILLAICKAFKGKNKLMLYKLLRSVAKNEKSQLSFFRLKASLSSHPTAYILEIKKESGIQPTPASGKPSADLTDKPSAPNPAGSPYQP